MKGTAEYYDKIAKECAENGYTDDSEFPCLMDFIQQFEPGSRFLDLCCGAGYESQRIHACGYEVVGIDFSEECLRIAREKNPTLPFYYDNLLNDYSYIGRIDRCFVGALFL